MDDNTSYTLIGEVQKPYGLLGEVKIKPVTFDPDRHEKLKEIFWAPEEGSSEIRTLKIRASRADARYWYLKFEGCRNPESVADLSGGVILIGDEQALEAPEDEIFVSEVVGMQLIDELGASVGIIEKILETQAGELLVIPIADKPLHLPWNPHFIKEIIAEKREVHADLSTLRGVLF
jgi:16S rRNA processing protein RimM